MMDKERAGGGAAARRVALAIMLVLAASFTLGLSPRTLADALPASLSNAEFWTLIERISEPSGYFESDNLTSNELSVSAVATKLANRVKPGGVYLGVGPEQNFTYIAALRPKIGFIIDIRRANLQLHLMYKALFELAADRAEFVSLLFSKKLPDGLSRNASAADLMKALAVSTSADGTYEKNLAAIVDVLTKRHRLPLADGDLEAIGRIYRTFYECGPSINYSASAKATACPNLRVTWAALMAALDEFNVERSFLASEDAFATVKTLQSRNLIVPVVGDFAGPTTLRAVAAYLKAKDATLSAFYISNVDRYLAQRSGGWISFCNNVATMPLDETSVFVRGSGSGSPTVSDVMSNQALIPIATQLQANNCTGR